MRSTILIIGLVLLGIISSGCLGEDTTPKTVAPETTASPVAQPAITESSVKPGAVKFSLTSTGFEDENRIPVKYTCDGKDVSPTLSWGTPPKGTKSLALIVDDPDAPGGTFTHWVLFNLPADTRGLPEGVPKIKTLENGGLQGVNDFGELGYNGPCPPPGPAHTYRFILYAIDAELSLTSGVTKEEIMKAMEGHVLAKVELKGKSGR
jgi:Raf kinase inhibitor-like YbhB/YbcL family protein